MKVNFIRRFFESKPVQNFYKKACDPRHANFFNNTLPTIETAIATTFYCISTERQKDIPREQKNILQWQNILGGVAGMGVGSFLNRKVSNLAKALEPKLDKNIVDIHKVKAGLCVGLPLLATALVMRFGVPIVTAYVSSKIEDKRREQRKLNVKA